MSAADSRLARTVAALAPLLSLDAGLRALAITPDRVQGGGSAHDPRERLSDRGVLDRARVLSERLGRHPRATAEVLRWLAASAYGLGMREAARRYAETHAPIELRDALAFARVRTQTAENVCAQVKVQRRGARGVARRSGVIVVTTGASETAAAALANARHLEAQAERELVAWGAARITAALDAWERVDVGASTGAV